MSTLQKINELVKIEWKIVDLLTEEEEGHVRWFHSPTFNFTNATWRILLGVVGKFLTGPDSSSLILMRNENCDCAAEYTLGLKKVDGTVEVIDKGIMEGDKVRSAHCYLKLSDLMKRKSELAPSNIITVTCSLVLKGKRSEESNASNVMRSSQLNKLGILSDNLKDLFANKIACDIVLSVKDKEFHAHKAILIARSKVFAAMFQHHTLEYQTGVITIPDCDPDTFQEFLEYLYSGKLRELPYNSILHLFETSEKYEVLELKSHCIEFLMRNLGLDNLYDIITMADMYGEEKLFSSAQDVFNKNFAQIVQTSGWEQLMQNDHILANRLLKGFDPDQKKMQ